jgi:hypothetical protein
VGVAVGVRADGAVRVAVGLPGSEVEDAGAVGPAGPPPVGAGVVLVATGEAVDEAVGWACAATTVICTKGMSYTWPAKLKCQVAVYVPGTE